MKKKLHNSNLTGPYAMYLFLCAILIAVGIFGLINSEHTWNNISGFSTVLCIGLLPASGILLWMTPLAFSVTIIDEHGIILMLGKKTIRQILWTDIRFAEADANGIRFSNYPVWDKVSVKGKLSKQELHAFSKSRILILNESAWLKELWPFKDRFADKLTLNKSLAGKRVLFGYKSLRQSYEKYFGVKFDENGKQYQPDEEQNKDKIS